MDKVQATTETVDLKTLAKGIGQQANLVALNQVATEDGYNLAEKVNDGKEFQYSDMVYKDLKEGNLSALKIATGAAIKVAAEKGMIGAIPAGTDASYCADISNIGVESTKTFNDVAEGRCTPREGMERMVDVVTSTLSRSWTEKGRKIGAGIGSKLGAKIGTIFGPAGVVIGAKIGGIVGGFVGAMVGRLAGTKVGQAVVTAAKKVVSVAKETAKKAWEGVKSVGRAIFSSLRSLLPW